MSRKNVESYLMRPPLASNVLSGVNPPWKCERGCQVSCSRCFIRDSATLQWEGMVLVLVLMTDSCSFHFAIEIVFFLM